MDTSVGLEFLGVSGGVKKKVLMQQAPCIIVLSFGIAHPAPWCCLNPVLHLLASQHIPYWHWAEVGCHCLPGQKVKPLWLSPAFLLYLLITVVLQSYFMYMWRQDQPLHFHLTYFHFLSTFRSYQMSLSTPCSAALPFMPTHKQHIDCCLFSSSSSLLFSCCNEGGFSSTFSYNCLFTSVMRARKNELISS